jgi:small conductance mechanosensitive channel
MSDLTFQNLLTAVILFLPRIIAAIVVLIVSLLLAGLSSRLLRSALERRKFGREFTQFICEVTKWSVICLGIVVSLQQVDFDVTAFLTGVGILGFTVGFALQDVSKNFIAGLLLLLQQPFMIGETIQVTGYTGEVTAISMRATTLKMDDGQVVLIPNATVFTSPIVKQNGKVEPSAPANPNVKEA